MIRRKGFENKINEPTSFPRGMRRSRPKAKREIHRCVFNLHDSILWEFVSRIYRRILRAGPTCSRWRVRVKR